MKNALVLFWALSVATLSVGSVRADSSCESLQPAMEQELRQAASAPFEIYYVGDEFVDGESYGLEKLGKLPLGDRGVQPFYDFSASQSECILGAYVQAEPYIRLLAQAFLEQGKIKKVLFAGLRSTDHLLVMDVVHDEETCVASHDEGPNNVDGTPLIVCDRYETFEQSAEMVFEHCPTQHVFYWGGEPDACSSGDRR